jgi:hypothetical protein
LSLIAYTWVVQEADARNPAELAVLCALADKAWDDGTRAYPSIDTIAEDARMSRSTAQRTLTRLEERGVIRRGDQALVAGWHYRPVVWDLVMFGGPQRDHRGRASRQHPAGWPDPHRETGQVDLPHATNTTERPPTEAGQSDTPRPIEVGQIGPGDRSAVTYNPGLTQYPPTPAAPPQGSSCPRHRTSPATSCRACGTSPRQAAEAQQRAAVARRRSDAAAALEAERAAAAAAAAALDRERVAGLVADTRRAMADRPMATTRRSPR